jgi:signal transduction histidine kinase
MMASMFVAVVWHARRHQTAMEQLQRSGEREREFVRHASHQLRTPITVARGHVELVRLAATDPQSAEDTEVVLGELDRLSRISDRLLILATAEHRGFVHSSVDLGQVVETTARRWPPAADRDWRVDIVTGGHVSGDAERLSAALDAMIENAVKATVPGDPIAVVLRADGNAAVLEVIDSGIGIAETHLQRVFDRFWSAPHAGRSDGGGGTGLGLAAVKAIAEAHDGSAEALAMPGGGATVRMRLAGFVPPALPPAVTEICPGAALRNGPVELGGAPVGQPAGL